MRGWRTCASIMMTAQATPYFFSPLKPIELFFSIVILFAITQLSHTLLLHLTYHGILQTMVLWFAIWLGWQYTALIANKFDLHRLPVRLLIFGLMLVSLLMVSVISTAFNYNGLIFAISYVTIQVGRTLVVLLFLGNKHELTPYFGRMLGWLFLSALFWILGGSAESEYRLAYWALAVACEFVSPLFGFWLPFIGRSKSSELTFEKCYLVERCQLMIVVALGGTILGAGTTLSNVLFLELTTIIAFIITFMGCLAMWWLYFNRSSTQVPENISKYLPYLHAILIVGIIGFTVGGELIISDPGNQLKTPSLIVLVAGPLIYLIGNAIYKMLMNHHFPFSHLIGILALVLIVPFANYTDTLKMGGIVVLILVLLALWEGSAKRL